MERDRTGCQRSSRRNLEPIQRSDGQDQQRLPSFLRQPPGRAGQQPENQRRDLRKTGKLRICFLRETLRMERGYGYCSCPANRMETCRNNSTQGTQSPV